MAFILIPVMIVVAYLLGSLSAAIIVSRYLGMEDPRTYGSGNPGASNMLRSGRKDAAALTLLGDALKGLVAVWLALMLQSAFDMGDGIVAMAGLAVVAGHMWPLFFHFKGGKGVATALGVILGMSFWTAFWAVGLWLLIAFKFKKSSLAALITATVAPFISFIVQTHHPKLSWSLFAIALLILYRHKDNIQRLMAGNELDIGSASSAPAADVLHDGIQEELAKAEEFNEQATTNVEVYRANDLLEQPVASVKDDVKDDIDDIKDDVEEVIDTTKQLVQEATEQAKDAVEHVVATTKELAQEMADNVKETAEEVVQATKELAQEATENVKETVERAKSEIDETIAEHDAETESDAQQLNAPEMTTLKSKNSRKKK